MTRRVPCRLHVLLAREALRGVVIRRGPSRYVALIGWDRNHDQFTVGQWLHGRIYERRCDLSPDGEHLIYFAMNGRWDSEVKGSWTAVSKAPYLRALALFAKGDCWHGGGLFLSSNEYWLNDGYGHELLHDTSGLRRSMTYPWHESYGGECPGVYYIRLQRDGWTMTATGHVGSNAAEKLFEKRVNDEWQIRKLAHATTEHPVGRGCYFDTHELRNIRTGRTIDLPTWEWVDVDRHRLVWAEAGRLFAGSVDDQGLTGANELFDFNPLQFEELQAPY